MSLELALFINGVVLGALLIYLAWCNNSAMEIHMRKHVKLLKQEIEDIEDNPDYDLPTYEGKALRERHKVANQELDILEDFTN